MGPTQRRRVARVYTNETCNQNCGFCDRRAARERASFVAFDAVAERIASAGAPLLVLTGGEPTLRRDLAVLIARAKESAERVELETNAALIDEARARTLAAAGLDLARVHVPAWGDASDVITRDPGGFEATLRGMRALVSAGVALEVCAPVIEQNQASLASLPQRLADATLPVEALVVSVPVAGPVGAALLPLPAAARVIEQVHEAAKRLSIPMRLDEHTSLPPCLFDNVARIAHLFSLTPGGSARAGYQTREACQSCSMLDRCPGLPESAGPEVEAALRPVTSERVRRRLSLISTVREQVKRELFQDEIQRRPNEPNRLARTVRINFQCNQSCRFCFVSTHLPTAPDAEVESAIVEAARQGANIALSGGEPTLHPRLVDFVRLASAEGASLVELQTNATRLAEPELVGALMRAGLDLAYVSLHGSHAALSDGITGAPGTFDATVAGLDEISRGGLTLRLSFVFCQANLADFPTYVRWVAGRWPGAEIGVSFVAASTDLVPRTVDLVPRYSDVVPHLARGMEIASELGVRLSGFESMCGLPLCLVPEGLERFFTLPEAPEGYDGGEVVRAAACDDCDLRGRCFGLRRGYAALHGTGELRPVRLAEHEAEAAGS